MDHPLPEIQIRVNGTPLSPATMDWINLIELKQTSDGADILTIHADAWDPIKSAYRILDERGLMAGNHITFWAGYGRTAFGDADVVCKGRFQLMDRQPTYEASGPSVVLTGYDGLRRMMDNTQSRVFATKKGVSQRDSEIAEKIAKEYGFATDEIPAIGSPPPQAASYAPTNVDRRAVVPSPLVPGDRVKPAGLTDLAFLKKMAEGLGNAYPRIRYDAERDKEVFVFRPPASAIDDWSQRFWYRNNGTGDLIRFSTHFSVADAPTGIEILAWDPTTKKPYRIVAKMTQTGPQVTLDTDQRVDEKIDPAIKSGAAMRLSILGSGSQKIVLKPTTKAGKTWNPEKEVRDVLTASSIRSPQDATIDDLIVYAKLWLLSRQSAWWTCEGSLENQAGIHLMDADQVHEFRGLAEMDEGYYIMTSVTHTWEPANRSHTVNFEGQKLIEQAEVPIVTGQEVMA